MPEREDISAQWTILPGGDISPPYKTGKLPLQSEREFYHALAENAQQEACGPDVPHLPATFDLKKCIIPCLSAECIL